MANLTRKVLKVVAVVGTVPVVGIALGYRIRSTQASEANSSGEHRVYKVSDLPIYPTSVTEQQRNRADHSVTYPKNVVEEQISNARRAVQDFFGQFSDSFDSVKTKVETGVEHSRGTLDYIQNNPGELPRVAFIAVAGAGGIVLGYRGGILRKLAYGTIGAVSCAALCYPKKTVELSQTSADYVKELWRENIGQEVFEQYWPFRKDDAVDSSQKTAQSSSSSDNKTENRPKLKGDIGQSNPADKDLYSTRSS